MNNTQTGTVPLVAGQQSYAIAFPTSFGADPSFISAQVQMPNSSGEVFEASVDQSSIAPTSVTVWLSGVPSSASAGGFINWLAVGEGGELPPVPTPGFTGIKTVTLCNRIGRRGRG